MKGFDLMRKHVQITFELFIYLVQYFVLDMASDELFSKIAKVDTPSPGFADDTAKTDFSFVERENVTLVLMDL